MKPVLIIDAKSTEHILHRQEVKSNRLRVRRVKSEDNLADMKTKAISNKIIRKHAMSMGYIDAPENLKAGNVMGLWIEESERADQSSSDQQKTSLESTDGMPGQPKGKGQEQRERQRRRGQRSARRHRQRKEPRAQTR